MNDEQQDSLEVHVLETAISSFRSIKALGDGALSQLYEDGVKWVPDNESNSIALIVKHIAGNMLSRWTDFLTSDGEKPNRNRDDEFVDDIKDLTHLKAIWETGWSVLLHTLESLQPEDLLRNVTIRSQDHTVIQAILRQISHYGYHVGQIVYAAKAHKSASWQTLSIAKGGSGKFNENMMQK
ncbi:DUF1572 family protein [Cohnella sp.]|uniref:DUF1572 family protein n=1 Tax=Cohnella sp. TaxID=1883426 RepID=UPI003567D7A2